MLLKKLHFMILLAVLGSAPAVAATFGPDTIIRYEFDVVESRILFVELIYRPDYRELSPTENLEEYRIVASALHPLGDLVGQTGRVVLDLNYMYSNQHFSDEWKFTCVSGILCGEMFTGLGNWVNFYYNDATDYFEDLYYSAREWDGLFDLASGTGHLFYSEDADLTGSGWIGDLFHYSWFGPYATFTLANVTRTVIAPVPLPGSLALYGLALVPAAAFARRRRRALEGTRLSGPGHHAALRHADTRP